ncbi:hypothetical protein IJF93_02345 [Candidatus Saccharibacteria bacterium]|nr:hypothetical protein [Candidatus Saccharibacteria bacterium]
MTTHTTHTTPIDLNTGDIYLQIADRCLEAAYDMYPSIRKDLLDENGFNTVEAFIRAEGSIAAGIASIIHSMNELGGNTKAELYEKIVEEVLHKHQHEALDELKAAADKLGLSKDERVGLATLALEAVHDHRVSEFASEWFFRRDWFSKQWRFLPAPLIGLEEFKKNLVFVEPVLETLGLTANDADLAEGYRKLQAHYLLTNGIRSKDTLERHLRTIEYAPAPESALTVIRHYSAATMESMMPRLIRLLEAKSAFPWLLCQRAAV